MSKTYLELCQYDTSIFLVLFADKTTEKPLFFSMNSTKVKVFKPEDSLS